LSLRSAPLLYVFYETASLTHQRDLCERIIGLPVIENQFHPPHEYHGLVKYDAGQTILSLNLSRERKFEKDASDGLITVLSVESEEAVLDKLRRNGYEPPRQSGDIFTDSYGHHYIFQTRNKDSNEGQPVPAVRELRLTVSDLGTSVAFYRDTLGLELLDQTQSEARFATGGVDLVIVESDMAPDGRPPRYTTYLLVFYTRNICEAREALIERGLVFKSHRVGFTDIGGSARFFDPSGHVFCIYEPSEESLTWGSGSKVKELIADRVPA